MDSEEILNVLTSFSKYRTNILKRLDPIKDPISEYSQQEDTDSTSAYMNLLMEKPISQKSRFSDNVWDFNNEYPNAARNVQGAKLRINFAKFPDIPVFILIELKIIFELALLNNLIFKPQNTGKKSRIKEIIKANSLIPIFESGLEFVNEIFKQASYEFGNEFVHSQIKTLSDITPELYYKAAQNYKRVKGKELDIFFKYLRHPASRQYVFKEPLTYVELNSLEWNKVTLAAKTKKQQVLPDLVFESLSRIASFIVVDFLNAIGDREKISDTNSLERFNTSNHSSWASQQRVTHEILQAYTALRLRDKGYSSKFVTSLIKPYDWMKNNKSDVFGGLTLRKELRKWGYELDSLRRYFNLVSYSCLYLVGQYTGMRPSELSEVKVENCSCLVQGDGVWLIESIVKKHREEITTGLFDDRWVAIPIVRDAILAASYIAKIKASPYLVSSVDTVSPGDLPKSMQSQGIKHQMDIFLNLLLDKNTAHQINFNAYMLRHTLTYQLFRAEVGLPLISFQLKHFVDSTSKYTFAGATSSATLGYGEIGEMLTKNGHRQGDNRSLRRAAELEAIKAAHNPNGIYYGGKAKEHKENLIKTFQGYMASGYSEEEVYEAMADQGVAVVYMGQGLCYGGKQEEYDPTLPCLGSMRCNPVRCKQAIITSKYAPKWREIYSLNKANLNKPEYAHSSEQIVAVINEAAMVLKMLGEEVEI